MNWKLILQLSLFGLAMGIATVFVIPPGIEPIFWLVIFITCAVIIAKKQTGKPLVHGLLVSVVNSLWIVAAHELWFNTYIANHPREAATPISPRLMMLLVGPVIGLISGLVLGLFSFIASRLIKPPPSAAGASPRTPA